MLSGKVLDILSETQHIGKSWNIWFQTTAKPRCFRPQGSLVFPVMDPSRLGVFIYVKATAGCIVTHSAPILSGLYKSI